MAAKEELLRSLAEQKQNRAEAFPELRDEWLRALAVLFRRFEEWLAESGESRLLDVDKVPLMVTEAQLGNYEAPSLKIRTPRGDVVTIVPRGRMVVGAEGRVDFECSPRKATLIRKDPQRWQFAQLAPERGGWVFRDLSEESFWETLRDLLT